MLFRLDSDIPAVGADCFVADSARVIGKVHLSEGASVWFGAVLRGDIEQIRIGRGSNVQDNSVFHTDYGLPVVLGENVTVGHSVTLHSCSVGSNSLIGMGATVLDGAEIGEESIVGANSLVPSRKKYPPRSLLIGSPAKVKSEVTDGEVENILKNAELYRNLARRFRNGLVPLADDLQEQQYKVIVLVPEGPPESPEIHLQRLKDALFAAGAGRLGAYSHCAWDVLGRGQFLPESGSRPWRGEREVLERLPEYRLEVLCPAGRLREVLRTVQREHPYESPAFEILNLRGMHS